MSNNVNIPLIPAKLHRDLVRAHRAERVARKRKADLKAQILARLGASRIARVAGDNGAYVLLSVVREAYEVKESTFDDLRHTADILEARAKLRARPANLK